MCLRALVWGHSVCLGPWGSQGVPGCFCLGQMMNESGCTRVKVQMLPVTPWAGVKQLVQKYACTCTWKQQLDLVN